MQNSKFLWCLVLLASYASGASLDLRSAVIVLPSPSRVSAATAARMLSEEIEKRTQLRLPIVKAPSADQPAVILRERSAAPAEGFTLTSTGDSSIPARVTISGNDERGLVFGAGYLLRQLRMSRQSLTLEAALHVETAPQLAVRGQQLGYRPKTNAYDAWNVALWEQYIRELAIFGNNTVELIPPRSDDAVDSPHFPLPPLEMMQEMSRIAASYALNVSVWFPAMDRDYSDPATVAFALHEWEQVYRRLPRLDVVFVPGGDPGHTQPKFLMALLEKQTALLHRYHPHAQMWMSPQGFRKEWMEEFFAILQTKPPWLSGIVYGPQIMYSLPDVRARVPSRYPIRFYPDITHSLRSQFPVPGWDAAFALTEGREVINPRPLGEAAIFRHYRSWFSGFVTYSEGCNDDVNKIVWSTLGWNPDADVKQTLVEYSRLFVGDRWGDALAEGLLALERNWQGPLLGNTSVDKTLLQFQQMEAGASPQTRLSWRFQQALYRAYYDAFLRARLPAETAQEQHALSDLRRAPQVGSLVAMDAAQRLLDRPLADVRALALRARVFELAEALFQSIHMQLSVPRYQAIALDRGANLDAIDFALNNRAWLEARFDRIRLLSSEPDRLAAIHAIVNWTNPGPGGFYDDLGNTSSQPHLVADLDFAQDPDFLHSPHAGFAELRPDEGIRLSWFTHAESLYDAPLALRYTGLDPHAAYRVRVTYLGDMPKVPIRLVANNNVEIHPFLSKPSPPEPLEFALPLATTHDGSLLLQWTRPPGLGGNGRGCQVAEVWLIRLPPTH